MAYWISKEDKSTRVASNTARSSVEAYEHKLLHDAEELRKTTEQKPVESSNMLGFILGRMHLRDTFTEKR